MNTVTAQCGQCCDGDRQGCSNWEALACPGEEAGMGELGEGGRRTHLAEKAGWRVLGGSSTHVAGNGGG